MKLRIGSVAFVLVVMVAFWAPAQDAVGVPDEVTAELNSAAAWEASPVYGNPPSSAVPREPDVTVFFSDFESDNGGLVGSLDWEWGTAYSWSAVNCDSTPAPPAAPYSGAGMWGTVLNTCYNNLGNNQGSGSGSCSNTAPTDDSILVLTVDLSAYTAATLTWYEWLDVYSYFDWTEVRINGASVSTYCPSSYAAPTAWVQQSQDLTPYVGGVVTIEWHFMASTVINRAGWYIDDVLVDGTPVPVELQTFTVD